MPGIVSERGTGQVTALRVARLDRGWDVPGLIARMRVSAEEQELKLPCNDRPLAVRIQKWEQGEGAPYARYVSLLTAVYGKTAAELGLPDRSHPPIDNERWGRLYAQYFDWTVRYIWRRINDRALAQDLAQDAFIEIGRTLHKVDPAKDEELFGFVAQQARWTMGLAPAECAWLARSGGRDSTPRSCPRRASTRRRSAPWRSPWT